MTVISRTDSLRQWRVWLDELPDAPAGSECATRSLLADEHVDETYSAVAVEKWWAQGPKVAYGLLGAEFLPNRQQDRLDVSICYTREHEQAEFETTLGASWNHMKVGLTTEFLEGFMDFIECHATKLGPGELRFTCAAVEPIGSSAAMFWDVAMSVIDLFAGGRRPYTEQSLQRRLDMSSQTVAAWDAARRGTTT